MQINLQTIQSSSNQSGSSSNQSLGAKVIAKNIFEAFQPSLNQTMERKEAETSKLGLYRKESAIVRREEAEEDQVIQQKSTSNNTQKPDESSQNDEVQDVDTISSVKVRVVGVALIVIVIAMAFTHLVSTTVNEGYYTNLANVFVGAGLMMSSIFVVLGFGLTLTYYGQNIFTSFFTVLYTVSATLIIEPLVIKFWLNLFHNGFNGSFQITNTALTILYTSNNGGLVSINYWNMRLALQCAISQLIIYFAIIGRIQVYKVVVANLFFILIWTLNYSIVSYVYRSSSQSRINDDFSINMVYLFGGIAGLVVIMDTPSRLIVKSRKKRFYPLYPKILACLGMFFMFMAFVFTHAIIGKKDNTTSNFVQANDQRVVFMPEGSIAMFFAISASILSCASWSVIFNHNSFLHLNDFLGSSIAGAVMYGPVANFAFNLSIPIILGMVAGFICALYKIVLLPKFNKKNLKDSLGFMGPFFVCPILGNIISTPIIIFTYSQFNVIPPTLYGSPIQSTTARYVLISYVLCCGLGMVGGMAVSSVFRWFKGNQTFFGDRLNFVQEVSFREINLDYSEPSALFESESSKKEEVRHSPRQKKGRVTQKRYIRESIERDD